MLAAAETSRSLTGAAWDAGANTPPLAAFGSCDPVFVPKDPWGNIDAETGPEIGGVEYAFTGREWDRETGLYYYRARYYDPKAGRFISEDPIGFDGGVNFYAYVANNPVKYRDPLGLLDPEEWRELEELARKNVEETNELLSQLFPEGPVTDTIVLPDGTTETIVLQGGTVIPAPSLSACKRALKQIHSKLGKLAKGRPGKFGTPQRGDATRGYRGPDPPHPNARPGSPETGWHFNWWDFTKGKFNKGQGPGQKGAIPIE